MKYRKFGKLNWQISEIGFGAWAIGGDMWGPQDDEESIKGKRFSGSDAAGAGLRMKTALFCRVNFAD